MHNIYNKSIKQDRQALLKAKHCPGVATASCTRKNPRTCVTFDLETQ